MRERKLIVRVQIVELIRDSDERGSNVRQSERLVDQRELAVIPSFGDSMARARACVELAAVPFPTTA